MTILFWCLMVCLCGIADLLENENGESACFKVRFTKKGLTWAKNLVMDELEKTIVMSGNQNHQVGNINDVKYTLTSVQIMDFKKPESKIFFLKGMGLRLDTNGASLLMIGFFQFSNEIENMRAAGDLEIFISGLDFSMNLNIGVDPGGGFTFAASDYNCEISEMRTTFYGRWLVFFSTVLEDKVKRAVKDNICESLMKHINKILEAPRLKELKGVGPGFELNTGQLHAPSFQWSYMETFHKCELFSTKDGTRATEIYATVEPPAVSDIGDTQKMVYVWISEYMFNTIGYVFQMANRLVFRITAENLRLEEKGMLNTTCTSLECLGILIPDLQETFPNSTIELEIVSNSPPRITITPEGLKVHCNLTIRLYVRQSDYNLAYLMSLNATMETSVTASLHLVLIFDTTDTLPYGLFFKINDVKLFLNVTNSFIGPNDNIFLQTVINNVLKIALIPRINGFLEDGYIIPGTKADPFTDLSIRFLQHAILIEANLR